MKRGVLSALILCLCGARFLLADTVVRFETTLGDFEVQLYDRSGPSRSTPLTVANFLAYVNAGTYDGSFIHRSIPGFVVQGGGFKLQEAVVSAEALPTNAPVQNEPGNSNVRGTIAMAKVGGDPDSATNQWFFNLADNSGNLDNQNEGFTVFGHVLGDGMDVVDAIAGIQTYNAGAPFDNLPLLANVIARENFIYVESVTVVPFEFTDQLDTDSGVTLKWTGSGDRPVQVQRATNLVTTDWQTVATLTGGEYTDENPPDGPVYYRLKLP